MRSRGLPHTIRITEDFNRDVYCLFGLPADNLTFQSAALLFKKCVREKKQKILATININWVVISLIHRDFRTSILNSDICAIDGKPLLLIGRLLSIPIKQTLPGSSMMEHLLKNGDHKHPYSIFFLGGDSDAGKNAFEKTNSTPGGLTAVGYCNPGFGDLESLSARPVIDRINNAAPDILLVALGAYKGTCWIENNKNILNPRIISHLGATLHFLGGRLKRAPDFFQKTALEWFWRILQEPKLAKRYLFDGIFLAKLLVSRLPLFFFYRRYLFMMNKKSDASEILVQETPKWIRLNVGTHFTQKHKESVRHAFYHAALKQRDMEIDFHQTQFVDSSFLAYFLLLAKHQKMSGKKITIVNVSSRIENIWRLFFVTESLEALNISYKTI